MQLKELLKVNRYLASLLNKQLDWLGEVQNPVMFDDDWDRHQFFVYMFEQDQNTAGIAYPTTTPVNPYNATCALNGDSAFVAQYLVFAQNPTYSVSIADVRMYDEASGWQFSLVNPATTEAGATSRRGVPLFGNSCYSDYYGSGQILPIECTFARNSVLRLEVDFNSAIGTANPGRLNVALVGKKVFGK